MIIYPCMKYESNTSMYSKDIAWKPFFVCMGRMYVQTFVRTAKGDASIKSRVLVEKFRRSMHNLRLLRYGNMIRFAPTLVDLTSNLFYVQT